MPTGIWFNPGSWIVYPEQTQTWGTWNTQYDINYNITTTGNAATIAQEIKYYTHTYTIQRNMWEEWIDDPHHRIPERAFTPRETEEERQARQDAAQARMEEASRRRLAETERMVLAESRAIELLKMILTPEELLMMEGDGKIHVRGSEGGLFILDTQYQGGAVHGNITQVDEHGCVLGRLCVQPDMYDSETLGRPVAMPLADGWVGQYLYIKHNEEALKATANWYARRACQQPNVPILGQQRVAQAA